MDSSSPARERTTGVKYMGKMERSTRLAAMAIAGLFLATMFVGMATPVSAVEPVVWTQMPNMVTSRATAVTVTGSDGLIYVIGGFTGSADSIAVSNVSSYNPKTGEWKELAAIPVAVTAAAGAADSSGKIYIFGGNYAPPIATTQIYDIATDTWTTGADMPAARLGAQAAYVNGYIYVVGGYLGSTYSTVWYYTPSSNSWTVDTPLPSPRMFGALLAIGSDLYYIGGLSDSTTPVQTVHHFNIYTSANWEAFAPLPVARGVMAGTVGPDGVMYVFGGAVDWFYRGTGNVTGYYYDWSTTTWGSIPDLPIAVRYASGAASTDGRVWCLGGSNSTTALKSVFSLQVASYTLTMTPSSVGQGQSLMITVTPSFAFTIPDAFGTYGYIVGSDGSVYGTTGTGGMGPSIYIPVGKSFAIVMPIPQGAPVGAYTLVIAGLEYNTVKGPSGALDGKNASFSVTSAPSMQDQLNALKDKQFDSTMGTILLVLVVIAIVIMLVVMVLVLRKRPT